MITHNDNTINEYIFFLFYQSDYSGSSNHYILNTSILTKCIPTIGTIVRLNFNVLLSVTLLKGIPYIQVLNDSEEVKQGNLANAEYTV